MASQAESGIYYTDGAGATGWMTPVGWMPQIKPKPYTTPDLDAQAGKAEPWEGGVRGHIVFQGIPVAIENPAGSTRSGIGTDGKRWSTKMRHHYGFVKRRFGADGDGVDCFIGPDLDSQAVFIVNQVDPATGAFDEHKVMLGFGTEAEAKAAYHANYSAGWRGFHSIASHTVEDFKDWLADEQATREIAKAEGGEHGDIPPGAHWITAHPNGPGTQGHPILIMPIKGSNGGARVIGGAKGKLNGLRLHGLKDPAQYKQEALERAKKKREADRERRASMTPEEIEQEKAASADAKATRRAAEEKFIQNVLGAATGGQGGEHGDLFAGEEDPKQAAAAHRARLAEAKRICREAERKAVLDAEARAKNGLEMVGGDAPLDIDQILSETQGKGGPGYNRALAKRAEANGMTADKLMEGVNALREAQGKAPKEAQGAEKDPAEVQAKIQMHKATKDLQAAKAGAMREAIKETLENNENLAHLLRARAALRAEYKQAMAKKHGITFEPGFQVAVSGPQEHENLVQSLHEQLLTKHMVGFLEEVDEHYPEGADIDPFKSANMEGMHASRGAGAFDLLHDVGLAALGEGVIDRDVVEALGPEAAAHVVARAIRQNFTPEDQEQVVAALEHHHLKEQEDDLPGVVEEAQGWKAKAAEIEHEMTESARDLPTAVELQKNKIEALKEARRLLGSTLGRMEARAALIAAMRGTPLDEQQIPLGRMTPEKALMTAAALGLKEGHYTLDHTEGEAVLTINGAGMDALVKPVDTAAVAQRELASAIKGGQLDEDAYLPAGFANRLADRYSNEFLEPPMFQRHHDVQDGDDEAAVEGKIKAWMGARLADGERPEDIVAHAYGGAQSGMSDQAKATWQKVLGGMVPLKAEQLDEHGQPIPEKDKATGKPILVNGKPLYKAARLRTASEIAKDLEPMLQGYMGSQPHEAAKTLHGQRVEENGDFHEALHRAIAADPRLAAAYIPVGELAHHHAASIRDFFYKEHFGGAKNSDEAKRWKFEQAVSALGPEPEKTNAEIQSVNLFAGLGDDDAADADAAASDQWVEWNNKRKALEAEYQEDASKPTLWDTYQQRMGGTKAAQETIQDLMRSRLNEGFHSHYQRLTGRTLQMASAEVARSQEHLKMTLGQEQAEVLESERKAKQAKMQNQGGKGFKAGKVADKLKEAKANATLAAADQAQGAMFDLSDYDEPNPDTDPDAEGGEDHESWQKPELAQGERFHLGTALENQIRNIMPAASAPFAKGKNAVGVDEGMHMSGKYAPQQRAVKAITKMQRMGLFYGAGSGKTGIMLGSLSTLHSQGKLKKAILAVPSVVQAQFGAEAVRFIDPASGFGVHAAPGESYEERLAAYRDPGKHAVVVTHQTLRDDTLKILGDHLGGGPEAGRDFLLSAKPAEAAAKVKEAFQAAGIDHNALMVDEAHGALDRDGKPDSTFSKVVDAHSHASDYMVMATGDPLKNDVTEIWSNLNKIDPHKYPPESRDEFMRRYKGDAALAKRSLAQELSRYWFNGKVDVGKDCFKSNPTVPLTGKQKSALAEVELASGKLRTGDPDPVKWAKILAPAKFEGKPEAEHQAIAEQVRKGVGTMLEGARNRIINLDPEGGKIQEHIRIAKERIAEGKPVVIFASNLEAVDNIHAAMGKAGLKSVSLTGRDSSKDKGEKAGKFQRGEADVIVMSDAGATGLNLQRGKCLIHHDLPKTAMTHNQRTARIYRLKQTSDVESITLMADHAWERGNWDRVKRKGVLGEIFQDPSAYLDDSGLAGDLKAVRARAGQGKTKASVA